MTVAERLRRLLREMTALERVVYTTSLVGGFAMGLVYPSFFLERLLYVLDRNPFTKAIGDSIPFDHPFFVAIVWVLATGMGLVQFALVVRLVAFLPSIGMRLFVKSRKVIPLLESRDLVPIVKSLFLFPLVHIQLGTLAAPGAASGCVAAMALGWLGAYETPRGFYGVHAFYASQSFLGAIVGIAVILYTPEYRHALPRLIAQVGRFLKQQVFVGQAIRSCDRAAD